MSDAAIACIMAALVQVTIIWVGYLKLKYGVKDVEDKVDANTTITRAGTEAAAKDAKSARVAASDAKTAAEDINKKLNGGIDEAIKQAVDPVKRLLEEHVEQDKKDMEDIKFKLRETEDYIHKRNHEMFDAINNLSLKFDRVLAKMEDAGK